MSEELNQMYLGDGVYAEKGEYHIILRTGSHKDHDCDNIVYLEPGVVQNLLLWVDKIKGH